MKTIYSILFFLTSVCYVWGQAPGFDFTRTRLFSGFDGKTCKVLPCIATDWQGTILLTYTHLLLTGSDVFYGPSITLSHDNGKTWSTPRRSITLSDSYDGRFRIVHNVVPRYSRFHSKWYALDWTFVYDNDNAPYKQFTNGKPFRTPYYADVDMQQGDFTSLQPLHFPFPFAAASPYGDPVELNNGDIIIPFYYVSPDNITKHKVVCVRYRFTSHGLAVVKAGTPIDCPELNRGLLEPALTHFQGKFYLTVRSDEKGMFCQSDDGLTFGPLTIWCWENGLPIGNKNTQQHWINLGSSLYLAYTRKNEANNHVFRNRAPVYSAYFDIAKGCLIASTEYPLLPELGARMGNFETISSGDGKVYFVGAEWMQPVGCERYGSDNSLWFIQICQPADKTEQQLSW